MKSIAKATLIGHIGKDPEMRYTPTGVAVCSFSVATSHSFKKNDEWQNETCWHNVVVWRDRAKSIGGNSQYRKGAYVYVEGSIRDASYQNKEGVMVYRQEIHATDVGLLEKSEKASGTDAPPKKNATYTPPDESVDAGSSEPDETDIPF